MTYASWYIFGFISGWFVFGVLWLWGEVRNADYRQRRTMDEAYYRGRANDDYEKIPQSLGIEQLTRELEQHKN